MKHTIYAAIFLSLLLPVSSMDAQGLNEPSTILHRAIETHSDRLMRKFFESWAHASDALRRNAETPAQRDAEAIFSAVWSPKEFHRLAWGWTADTIPSRSLPPYIVILSSVQMRAYKISSDSLRATVRKVVYEDEPESDPVPFDSLYFMAPPHLYGAKTLFYLEGYLNALDKYMRGWDSNSKANMAFISKYVSLSCHMGGCGAIGVPEITSIIINTKRDRADVPYRLGEHGGTASLSKTNGKWRVTSASMASWIE
ncbi:MAG TPA: hypothetical protein VFH95_04005 [Candidatus Kapabacteria bacterium]|nr:hypothetical protein [Candidatus Kapabacteria bacterium]